MVRALLVTVASFFSAVALASPLPFVPHGGPRDDVKLFEKRPQAADAGRSVAAEPDPKLRDAVADPKTLGRLYVSQALDRLSAGDAAGAIELSARALSLDPGDESAYAAMKLAESQLRAASGSSYRDAVAARPPMPAPQQRAPTLLEPVEGVGGRSFWRLVFSPIITGLLLLAVAAHVTLGKLRRRSLSTRVSRAAFSVADPASPLPPGYRFVRSIGEGGMGVVVEAEDCTLGRRVAIKKMRDEIRGDTREREHFLQEARMVAGLHHPTIVDIHTILERGDDLFLVFEYIEGVTVEAMLQERRFLSLEESKRVMRGVCEALDYAHRHGVVHRDLKPSNIMVTQEGEIKVMDFGVARRAKDSLLRFTLTETVAGTPLYMAPEADDGIVRKESDVYALGACLYEMVAGDHPFPAPATRSAKLSMRYIPASRQRAGLPEALDALIDAALQPDPDKRIRTPGEFLRRLEEVS